MTDRILKVRGSYVRRQAVPIEQPTLRDNLWLLADCVVSCAVGALLGWALLALWLAS